jgi:hypothetical protein
VGAERERIRQYLGFLYSTPNYAGALALHGCPELQPALQLLAREGRGCGMPARIPDARP